MMAWMIFLGLRSGTRWQCVPPAITVARARTSRPVRSDHPRHPPPVHQQPRRGEMRYERDTRILRPFQDELVERAAQADDGVERGAAAEEGLPPAAG